jgi:cytochrome c-type biogenesis protein CcmH/NrfF
MDSSNSLVLAHSGHWAAGLLYLAPVVIVVGALLWQGYKDRRDERDEASSGGGTA